MVTQQSGLQHYWHKGVCWNKFSAFGGCPEPIGICPYAYSIQVSHGPKDRAEPHNGLLLSARLGTLDASPGVLRHFCKVPRGEHGNDTVAHARSYCVVVQVDNFCEILPHSSGHLQSACSA